MEDYGYIPDLELAILIKKDDHRAFAEIFHRYNGLLLTHAFNKLNDREIAKDIVQEVFTNLWAKRAVLSFDSNMAGYLYVSVRNRIFDFMAREQKAAGYITSLQGFLDKGTSFADHRIREKMMQELILKEIAALPPRMRLVFEMSRKENLSHKEIADALSLSEQTVTDQIKKALRILRGKIGFLGYIAASLAY